MRAPLTGTIRNYSNITGVLHPHQAFTALSLLRIITFNWSWDEAFPLLQPFSSRPPPASLTHLHFFQVVSTRPEPPHPLPGLALLRRILGPDVPQPAGYLLMHICCLAIMAPQGAVSTVQFLYFKKTKVTRTQTKKHNVNSLALIHFMTRSCALNMSQSLVQILSLKKHGCLCIYWTVGSGPWRSWF